MVEISVVIPTYNRKGSLVKLINSLYGSDFESSRYEIIVIDDGSDDGTDKLLKDFSEARPNFSYKSVKNSGPGVARNIGAGLCRGEIIGFLDDDCVIRGNWLTEVSKSFGASGEKPDLAYGRILSEASCGHPFFRYWNIDGEHIVSFNIVIKKDIFLKSGGFDPVFSYWAEDFDFIARLKNLGVRIVYSPDMKVTHASVYKGFHIKDYIYLFKFWQRHDCLFSRHKGLTLIPFNKGLLSRNIRKVLLALLVFLVPLKISLAARFFLLLFAVWLRNLFIVARAAHKIKNTALKIKPADALRFIFSSWIIDPVNLAIYSWYKFSVYSLRKK